MDRASADTAAVGGRGVTRGVGVGRSQRLVDRNEERGLLGAGVCRPPLLGPRVVPRTGGLAVARGGRQLGQVVSETVAVLDSLVER